MFCPGIAGAGKIIIAVTASKALRDKMDTENIAVAQIFCSYKTDLDADDMLAAVLRQWSATASDLSVLMTLYEKRHGHIGRYRPNHDELSSALTQIVGQFSSSYIILDAVDEYSRSSWDAARFLEDFLSLTLSWATKVLVTSRHLPDIMEKFTAAPQLEIRARDDDVRRYVASQLSRLPRCVQGSDPTACQLQMAIVARIVGAVDGM